MKIEENGSLIESFFFYLFLTFAYIRVLLLQREFRLPVFKVSDLFVKIVNEFRSRQVNKLER